MNKIEPIFLIFPLIILILSALVRKKKYKKIIFVVTFIFYFILFICSENGSDYVGYLTIYNSIKGGVPISEIHGELLFILIVKIFTVIGLSYDVFRVVFLGFFSILFFISLYKLSPNYLFSFALMFLSYIIYLISAYRQFAVMAVTVYCFYLFFKRNKKILPICLLLISAFIHISAVCPLIFFIFLLLEAKSVKTRRCINIEKHGVFGISNFIIKHFIQLVLICLALRTFLFYFLSVPIIAQFAENFVGIYTDISLFNIGLFSRMITLIIICASIKRCNGNKLIMSIFIFYSICIMGYILVPYETFMGRLMNSARFLDILLIPFIVYTPKNLLNYNSLLDKLHISFWRKNIDYYYFYDIKYSKKTLVIVFLAIIVTMYIYQLLFQTGYYPYINMFFT